MSLIMLVVIIAFFILGYFIGHDQGAKEMHWKIKREKLRDAANPKS